MAAPPDKVETMTREERKREIREARAGFERIQSQVITGALGTSAPDKPDERKDQEAMK